MDPLEQRRIAQAGKEIDPGWYRVHRNVSIHLTRAALALGMTANQASLSMIALGVVGAVLLVPSLPVLNAIGFVVLYLAFLLDKVDGEIARLTGTANGRGIFLDRIHHRLVEPGLFVAVAAHEVLRGGGLVAPLVAGFATVVLANAIDENQHLAAYILYKRVREGDSLPDGVPPPRSRAWALAAAVLRPLKGFRTFIVALPLFAVAYAAQAMGLGPVPTLVLAASAFGLAAYLVFQCLYYLNEQLDAEAHAIARVLRTGMSASSPASAPTRRSPPGETRDSNPDGDSLMEQPRLRFGSTRVLLALLIAGPALLSPAWSGAAGTFYVDSSNPACSNSGPGTAGTPYCSISAAVAAQNGPGTTIRVAPGVYPEQVTVPASGTSGNPFVLEGTGTPANPALLEGSDNFSNPGLWSPAANTTWFAASATWSVLQVLADGDRLLAFAGAADSVPAGGFLSVPGTGLYVNLGGPNPGDRNVLVGRRLHGVLLANRSWVTIRNLRVHAFNSRGIYVDGGGSNVVVENNVIDRVGRYGINAEGATGVLIKGNRVSHGGDHGIALTTGTTNTTVDGNESHDNARPAVRAANGIYLFNAPGNRLRRNQLHHNQDSGMHVQAGSNLTVSVRNLAWANGDHGFDHLGVANNTHSGDVAYGNHTDGFSFEGNTQNQQMFNCIAAFNGLATGRYQMYADSSSVSGFASNDNIFWDPTTHEPVKFNKIAYATVAAYSAATGLDTRALEADPRFVDGDGGDLRLLAGSPAIDRANSGAPQWESADFQGMAPVDDGSMVNAGIGPVTFADRGAYEFGAVGIVGVPGDPSPLVTAWGVTPNPLAGEGILAFATTRPGALSVELYDVRGRRVRSLLDEAEAAAGPRTARLDGRGDDGAPLEAGIYFYRVRSVDGVRGGKFVVVR